MGLNSTDEAMYVIAVLDVVRGADPALARLRPALARLLEPAIRPAHGHGAANRKLSLETGKVWSSLPVRTNKDHRRDRIAFPGLRSPPSRSAPLGLQVIARTAAGPFGGGWLVTKVSL